MRPRVANLKPRLRAMNERVLREVADYYRGTLRRYGATSRGVDWNSEASQQLRFEQLLRVIRDDCPFSINDYGCGYGALAERLLAAAARFSYCGFDVAEEMVAAARERLGGYDNCHFVSDAADMPVADYTVASGIFNVRLSTPDDEWLAYLQNVLDDLARLSRRAFSFNALTSYNDPERRRDTLFYADPRVLFDHCVSRFSRRVALLHDYPLYEFTIVVRLED